MKYLSSFRSLFSMQYIVVTIDIVVTVILNNLVQKEMFEFVPYIKNEKIYFVFVFEYCLHYCL